MVQSLRRWPHGDTALEAVQRHPGHVHGDNLFVLPDDSCRVIDWQRPFLGPTELDIASMMDSLGFDPLHHVPPGIVQIRHFMLIHWITTCAVHWYPEAAPGYDGLTAEQASKIRSLF